MLKNSREIPNPDIQDEMRVPNSTTIIIHMAHNLSSNYMYFFPKYVCPHSEHLQGKLWHRSVASLKNGRPQVLNGK